MRFDLITLFPDLCRSVLDASILKRAQTSGNLEVAYHNPRDHATDAHRSVDDAPYGGGPGMLLRVDVLDAALREVTAAVAPYPRQLRVLLTPQGERFTQGEARRLASEYDQITLICGHYEGFDERIRSLVDRELSIGDYVLTGGELPALVVVDAVSRMLPGVLSDGSAEEESFSLVGSDGEPLLEYPHYTRPPVYNGLAVPEILLSGNHAAIARWRQEQALARTLARKTDCEPNSPSDPQSAEAPHRA